MASMVKNAEKGCLFPPVTTFRAKGEARYVLGLPNLLKRGTEADLLEPGNRLMGRFAMRDRLYQIVITQARVIHIAMHLWEGVE